MERNSGELFLRVSRRRRMKSASALGDRPTVPPEKKKDKTRKSSIKPLPYIELLLRRSLLVRVGDEGTPRMPK